MAATTRPWTRAELDRLPDDGNRYEVLDGALLVTPLPAGAHQRAAVGLASALYDYCGRLKIGVVAAPGAVRHGNSELQPDIAVYLDASLPFDASWDAFPRPALVIEILSPSTQRRDLGIKRAAYSRWSVPEYWMVDIERRTVSVTRSGVEDQTVDDQLLWQPIAELPPLEIRLATIFR